MKTILVSGASGIVGYGVLKALRSSGLELNLIGTTIYDDSVAQGFCDIFEKAIPTSDSEYISWLVGVIKKHKVDMIIPGIDADLYSWNKHKKTIENVGTHVLINNHDLIELCKDKWSFYSYLTERDNSYVIPSSLSKDFNVTKDKFGLPLLLKPRQGFGSKGIVRIQEEGAWNEIKNAIGTTLMVQPVIGNDKQEYTVSAYGTGDGGYHAYMAMRRELSNDGFTNKAEVVDLPEIPESLTKLCEIFQPTGPTNFQFRKTQDGLKLLEINPRISSSTSIRAAFGYNEAKMAVEQHLLGTTPTQPIIKQGRAVRYTEDKIFLR